MAHVYTGIMNGAVQTGYFAGPPQGLPGQLVFPGQNHVITGYPAQSDFLYCGRGVVRGTDIDVHANAYGNNNSPYGVVNPAANSVAANFVGILLRDQAAANDAAGDAGKRRHDMAGVLEEGFCFVKLYQDTAAKAPAFMVVNATNPLNAPVGSLVSDAVGGAAVDIPRLEWWATYNHLAQPCGIIRVYASAVRNPEVAAEIADLKARVAALEA